MAFGHFILSLSRNRIFDMRPSGFVIASFVSLVSALALSPTTVFASPHDAFVIQAIDEQNGRPVPLIEFRTTSGMKWITDNAGKAVIDAPELFDREVWFSVVGHGYDVPRDGFGFQGIRLTPTRGTNHSVRLKRALAAERLGRLTGSGLLAESQKIGEFTDWNESGVVGCDSVQTTLWKGKLFWFWGDTNLFRYPLGIFRMLGAESELHPFDLEKAPIQPKLEFFRDSANALRPIADIDHPGPVWLGGLIGLQDRNGVDHLVASYAKIQAPMAVDEFGLCEWNEVDRVFRAVKTLWKRGTNEPSDPEQVVVPDGHAVRYRDTSGKKWVLFSNPTPRIQIHDTYEDWLDPVKWQVHPKRESIRAREGTAIQIHRGDIAWSGYANKWVMVFTQLFGKASPLGEIWMSTADSPFGEWTPAVPIATHSNYTFYNPMIHSEWLQDDQPWIYWEGTYTAEFANKPERTPRYDYNQILYRFRIDDPVLQLIEPKR